MMTERHRRVLAASASDKLALQPHTSDYDGPPISPIAVDIFVAWELDHVPLACRRPSAQRHHFITDRGE
jgi:hypothetical protein